MSDTQNNCDIEFSPESLSNASLMAATTAAIAACLQNGDLRALRNFFASHETADVAALFSKLPSQVAIGAMAALETHDQARLFGYLAPPCQTEISKLISRRDLATIMAAMSPDERADLYKRLDPLAQEAVLPGLALAERDDLRRLASYPEGTVGAIMTSNYATLAPHLTAPQAIDALRRLALDTETIYQSYVTDPDQRLLGVVDLRDLLVARSDQRVQDIMDGEPAHVRAEAPREDAASMISRYDLLAMPVIDADDKLVGIVTQDDAMDVQEEEATSDFHKAGTVQRLASSVRDATLLALYRARISWLVLLVFFNIFSGAGIAFFEETIQANVVLLFFLPLLIASGGNAGSQSSTLMVRALATGDVGVSDWTSMLGREIAVALLLGLSMAVPVSLLGVLRAGPEIAVVVSITMVVIVLVGSLIGMTLPFLLNRFRLDPATASGPLITSVADVLGVLIYFGIATRILTLA
ncbi:MAG: magnesium transporter [Beijerinckiaceae bacterium]|nr:magnesium transporter [Beijerinckiaceae bacterium]